MVQPWLLTLSVFIEKGKVVNIESISNIDKHVLLCSQLPGFIIDEEFLDPYYNITIDNPWTGANIDFENRRTERDIQMDLIGQIGEHGYDTWSFKQYMYALEQENYCDFEVTDHFFLFNQI